MTLWDLLLAGWNSWNTPGNPTGFLISLCPLSRAAFLLGENLNPSAGTGPHTGVVLPSQSKTLIFPPLSRELGLINDSFLCQGCWIDLEKDAQCLPLSMETPRTHLCP